MNDSFKLYVDGTFSNEIPISGLNFQNNQTPIYFGEQVCLPNSVNSPNFKGKIDDIGIWNRALTQQEITTMYSSVEVPTYSDTCNNVSGSLTNGLVGYWPFCGNANDDSGNGNNGTVIGASLTTDRFGNSNSAYSFNGVSNYITINNTFDLEERTFNIWFNPSTINSTTGTIVVSDNPSLNNGVSQARVIKISNVDNLQVASGVLVGLYIGCSTSTNNWQMLTYVRTASEVKLYYNGNFVTTTPSGNYVSGNGNSKTVFGADRNLLTDFYNGNIDDIGIWNRALTPSEVTQLYNQNQCFTNITVTDTLIINVGQLSYNNPVTYANNITIAPNPASSQININFNNITDLNGGSLKVINSLGQEVATTPITISGTQSIMQLATWGGSGMYYVQIINPQGIVVDVKKIILQ
jgi:hypothetical protein